MESVLEGLLIGTGAGDTSALIIGAFQWIRREWMKYKQRRHLKSCITEGFSRMASTKGLVDPTGEAPSVKLEELRPVFFEEFMRNMEVAVNYRTTEQQCSPIPKLGICKRPWST